MKDVFGKTPVKFFMIGFTLTHWYTTSMKDANRFPKKTAFQDWGGAKLGTNNSYRSYKRKNRFGNKLLN